MVVKTLDKTKKKKGLRTRIAESLTHVVENEKIVFDSKGETFIDLHSSIIKVLGLAPLARAIKPKAKPEPIAPIAIIEPETRFIPVVSETVASIVETQESEPVEIKSSELQNVLGNNNEFSREPYQYSIEEFDDFISDLDNDTEESLIERKAVSKDAVFGVIIDNHKKIADAYYTAWDIQNGEEDIENIDLTQNPLVEYFQIAITENLKSEYDTLEMDLTQIAELSAIQIAPLNTQDLETPETEKEIEAAPVALPLAEPAYRKKPSVIKPEETPHNGGEFHKGGHTGPHVILPVKPDAKPENALREAVEKVETADHRSAEEIAHDRYFSELSLMDKLAFVRNQLQQQTQPQNIAQEAPQEPELKKDESKISTTYDAKMFKTNESTKSDAVQWNAPSYSSNKFSVN